MTFPTFRVFFLSAAMEFIDSLPEAAQKKIYYNLRKVAAGYGDVDLFKKLEGTDIWEFRTLYAGIAYRLLAFWDTQNDTLVVCTHGFLKKTQKTPEKEIAKAEAARQEYLQFRQ